MAYSVPDDLLIGDLLLGGSFNPQKFVNDAADEMNSKLGWVYALPLHPADPDWVGPANENSWKQLPEHQMLLLKTINNRLASGRLIMAIAVAGEDVSVHAYGASLVREALADLMMLANGEVDLTAEPAEGGGSEAHRGPGVLVYDDESLLLGFENTVLRGIPWYTRPGDN